jgi:protein-tyrosine phosphatase
MIGVCFVCSGNVCRSPTAEGIMQDLVERAGLADRVLVDSAGTAAFQIGGPPDPRSQATARARGLELKSRGRCFELGDFDEFDYILAMDGSNLAAICSLTGDPQRLERVYLLRDFEPQGPGGLGVPDPYRGGERGFEEVFEICEAACRGLLDHLLERHGLGG